MWDLNYLQWFSLMAHFTLSKFAFYTTKFLISEYEFNTHMQSKKDGFIKMYT